MENRHLPAEPTGMPVELYRLALDHSDQATVLIDHSLRIIYVNRNARELGLKFYQREPVIGMLITALSVPQREREIRLRMEEVFRGATKQLVRVFDTADGKATLDLKVTPVRNEQGMVSAALITGTNITELISRESKFREADEKWLSSLKGGLQGAWDWNLVTGEVSYSDAYKKLYGFEAEDQLQNIQDWSAQIHPEDRDLIEKAVKDHIESGQTFHEVRYRVRTKEGGFKWIWARGMVVGKDENGNALRMVGTHTDITEQVNAELHYRTLFKSNPLPCWIHEASTGKFLEVNDAAVTQYGFSEAEFLSGDLTMVNPEEQQDELQRRLRKSEHLETRSVTNWTHRKKNGERIIVDLKINKIHYRGMSAKLVVVHDVTAKARVEQELRKSNDRFFYAAKASSEALWEWDCETEHFYASQAYTDIFGWQVNDQRTFDEWHDYIHPADQAETIGGYYAALANPDCPQWKKEYRYKKKNGSYAHVIDKAVILRSENGKPLKVIGAIQDISEQKKIEEELRHSNVRYQHVILATSDIVWDWDLATRMIHWSDNYHRVFGWPLPADNLLPDDSCLPRFHPDDRERVISSLFGTIHDPDATHWHEEFRYLKLDGTYAFVSDRGYVIRNENGEAVRMIGAMQDITARKEVEAELRKSNDRFTLATRATSDAIYEWDVLTGELYWGEGLQRLFGFDPRKINLNEWASLIHPNDVQKIKLSLEQALANEKESLWKDEYRFERASGGYSFVLDRCFIMRDENGVATRVIGSMQDITDRHYHQQLLSLEKTIFELSTNPNLQFRNLIATLLLGIEDILADCYTSVILLRDDNSVEQLASPRLPADFLKPIIEPGNIKATTFVARTVQTRKTVIVEDIDTDPLWQEHKQVASAHGFKSCWSLPIIHSSGKVMGSFDIFYRESRSPSAQELSTFERVRNIIRVLMENNWSINEIKEANERFDIMMKATDDLIWDWNLETNIIYRDEGGLHKVYGVESNSMIPDFSSWMSRIHPEDADRVSAVIRDVLQARHQDHFDVEYRFLRNDGSYAEVYDRGIIVCNSEGRPVRMIGAAQNVTERKRLEYELLHNELEKQKAINLATVTTQEQERTEIGKELHDNVNQVLTTTKLYLDLATSSPELKDELIIKSSRNIINVINEIRQLSRSLMDPSIGDLGLMDSINDLIENINLTRRLHVKLATDKSLETILDANQKLTVFRIIQESLNNAIRHAKATTVSIRFHQHDGFVQVMIEDDGVGFNPDAVKKGAGLKNIQNRIYLINGDHDISTAPGKGCRITIKFPIISTPIELSH